RIRQRAQDSEAAIARRLERAQVEIACADEFDIQVMNTDLDETVAALESILELTQPTSLPAEVN
ncbi:MAG TPA: hypothetical protein V6D19_13900, partial [Stenomitos sp.]